MSSKSWLYLCDSCKHKGVYYGGEAECLLFSELVEPRGWDGKETPTEICLGYEEKSGNESDV